MHRHSVIASGGLVVTAVALVALLGLFVGTSPADEPTEQASLLVKCPPETVPAVLRALQEIDAEVYDLATLKPFPKLLPAPLADALQVMKTLRRTAEGVAADAGDDSALSIARMEVKPRLATLHVHAQDIEVLDALRQALAGEPTLRGRAGEAPRVAVGATHRRDPGWEQTLSLRLAPPEGVAEVSAPGGPRITPVRTHLQAAGAKLIYTSAERSAAIPGTDARVVSRQYTLAPTTPDALKQGLDGVAAQPGQVITRVRWKRGVPTPGKSGKSGKPGLITSDFEVSCIVVVR